MPRFALLVHDSPRGLHYDFFLEDGDLLRTWALPRLPELGLDITCDALADHRPMYLDYEGPISGDRGTVARWDQGTYAVELWTDEGIIVELTGSKIIGRIELQRQPDEPGRWRFYWKTEK